MCNTAITVPGLQFVVITEAQGGNAQQILDTTLEAFTAGNE